jgi:transcription elongation factor Elf1
MPMYRNQLNTYPHARVLGISVIQVECPLCGHLCRSLGTPDPDMPGSSNLPFISRTQEMDLVECLNCRQQFSLPETAFIPYGEEELRK